MSEQNKFQIRRIEPTEIDNLITFFLKAYGKNTVFQDRCFLHHYFKANTNSLQKGSIIAIDHRGTIVSHYGVLNYPLILQGKKMSISWGVNAYTLQEQRGGALNSKILESIHEFSQVNGVIGFTKKTADYYKNLGYNIFNFCKFTRYLLVLNYKRTHQTLSFIKSNKEFKRILPHQIPLPEPEADHKNIVQITKKNIHSLHLPNCMNIKNLTTTDRTSEFLQWRFLDYPGLKYTLYGYKKNEKIIAYIAFRSEQLAPFNHKVNRIIDLYGKPRHINPLLKKLIQDSIQKECIYIDFSMFGSIYEKELLSMHFLKLENEDCEIFPLVTSPIEKRTNNEYIGIRSRNYFHEVDKLSKGNVYFTRMDSDRDRLNQMITPQKGGGLIKNG